LRISKETLRGYILEEVLAYLIRNTGYELLVYSAQDPDELATRGHGLVVKGRGTVHQADVLGQLRWIPAFTYPLRLFVEAKFRTRKTGVEVVRNAVGTLLDINQKISSNEAGSPFRQRYLYAAAIFSTSGFSSPAAEMAFAHQISLIDLGTPDFEPLLDSINQTADAIAAKFLGPDRTERNEDTEETDALQVEDTSRGAFIAALRRAFRAELQILPEIGQALNWQQPLPPLLAQSITPALHAARDFNELFVGMANGPFMLVLRAADPRRFLAYADQNPAHEISIRWTSREDNGRTWTLRPRANPDAYELKFRLPEKLSEWVFSSSDVRQAALYAKQQLMSDITIYRYEQDRDLLIRLKYNRAAVQEN
jgi:hypothetical protein